MAKYFAELESRSDSIALGSEPTAASKRALGIYYTPAEAAKFIAKWAIRSRKDIILEPSFGGCALLQAAVDRLADLQCKSVEGQFYGYDVDPVAFTYLAKIGQLRSQQGFVLQDFLDTRPKGPTVSAVIANPPFVSYRRMGAGQRKKIQRWTKTYEWPFSREAGLWAYFLAHSLNFLQPGGRIAFILPSSIIYADYGAAIRTFISERFAATRFIGVDEQLFVQEGAVERTTILLAEGFLGTTHGTSVKHFNVNRLSELRVEDLVSNVGKSGKTDTRIPDPLGLSAFIASPAEIVNFGYFADAIIGEVTGDVRFFVKTAEEWDLHGITARDLKPIVKGSSGLNGIVLSKVDLDSLPLLFHPRTGKVTRAVQRYIESYSTRSRDHNVTFGKRKAWYKVPYMRNADAFIPSLSHSSVRLILNDVNVSCTNSVYKIRQRIGCPWQAKQLAIAIQTSLAQLSAELLSRTLGSGALKLEPSDILKLALPRTLSDLKAERAETLVDELDALMRTGDMDTPRKIADRELLLESGLMSTRNYELLTEALENARHRREKKSGF